MSHPESSTSRNPTGSGSQQLWKTERSQIERKFSLATIRSDLYPEGEFVPELEARLSIFDRGYTVGDNAYEYARTYQHRPFQVREHMDRMFTSLGSERSPPGGETAPTMVSAPSRSSPLWQVTRPDRS